MGNNKSGYWLQIISNLGILVGLALVGFQISDANRIASAQLYDTTLESMIARDLSLLGENPDQAMYRVLLEPSEATNADLFIADRIYGVISRQVNRTSVFSELGLYAGTTRGAALANYPLFACPYGLAYLDHWRERAGTTMVSKNVLETYALMRKMASEHMETVSLADRAARAPKLLMGYKTLYQK